MTTIPFGNSALQAPISLGSVFNGVASGLIISTAFNIPVLNGSSGSFPDTADLWLVLGSSITLSSGSPSIAASVIVSDDGENWEVPALIGGSALFPSYGASYLTLNPSQIYPTSGAIKVPGIVLPGMPSSGDFAKLIAFWNGGTTLPSSVTASLYVYGGNSG